MKLSLKVKAGISVTSIISQPRSKDMCLIFGQTSPERKFRSIRPKEQVVHRNGVDLINFLMEKKIGKKL